MKAILLLSAILISSPSFADERIIAAATHAPGVNGTFFRTDVRVVNLSNTAATFMFSWLPSNQDNSTRHSVSLEVAARASKQLDDIVATLFEQEGGGAIRISSEVSFTATSRTYTTSATGCPGTFGQFIPATRASEAVRKSVIANVRLSVDPASGFRSNVGLVNPAGSAVTATLNLRDRNAASLGSRSLPLHPYGHTQVSVATLFELTSLTDDNLYLEIAGSEPLIAYGSIVDNASGDPIYVEAIPDESTPLANVITARQWEFDPPLIDTEVGKLTTIVFRSVDIDHGLGVSGVGAFTCSGDQGGQCVLRPGEDVVVTFTPRNAGSFAFFCTRFCGESSDGVHGHATMRGTVVVK